MRNFKMRNFKTITLLFVFAIMLFCSALTAQAQTAQRTFVSTSGNDANTANLCSRNMPCRGFAAAISVVAVNGEVVTLDSGGYGSLSITKPVQIISPLGVYAAITATTGSAINVNVGEGEKVVLRGLILNSLGAANGINLQSGSVLHIESCVINGFSSKGIYVERNFVNDTTELFIKDTIVRNGGADGIYLRNSGSGSLVKASIDNCRIEKNAGIGLVASNNARVTVRGSIVAGHLFGFSAEATISGLTSEINLESCVVTNNSTGLYAGNGVGTSLIRVSNSTITNNIGGISITSGGQILSRLNNTVEGNLSNNDFPAMSTYTAK